MAFEVVRARGCDGDLAALFDALVAGYRALGDTLAEAHARAALRLRSIEATLAGLGRTAFLGRARPDLMPGLRLLTADRTLFAFILDEDAGRVRVLAILPAGPSPLGPSPLAPLLRAATGQTTATPSASAARRSAASSVASRPRARSASSRYSAS
jgi:plasmid stabilization system protein ParE